MIRVMIVEDHDYVRGALVKQIDAVPDMQVVGDTGTGEEAVRLAAQLQPNVVMMDVYLPGMDGAEATRRIKRASPRTGIVVLTGASSTLPLERMRDAGAVGFLSKMAEDGEVLTCVYAASRNQVYICQEIMARNFTYTTRHYTFDQLSKREREILGLIIQGKRNKDIADMLAVHEKTVHTHKTRILDKLGLSTDFELARYVAENRLFEKM